MDIITPKYSQFSKIQKPWFKKPLFYIFVLIAIVLGYFSFYSGSMRNDISADNSLLLRGLAKIFSIKNLTDSNRLPDLNPMPQPEDDRLDVLILGIRGENDIENGGLLTDSMMILSLEKKEKKAVMISIPRDLYIDMVADDSNGKQIRIVGKINEVYENHGLDFTKQILSKITGVYIDKAVVFNFNAFKTIVDDLGGIDIYLAQPFTEPHQWGYPFSLPAGSNHINGDQALYYVRSRYSTNDFDRAKRQQDVIKAIKTKAESAGLLSNPAKIISLFSGLSQDIKTDFQIWNISDLLSLANSISGGSQVKDYFLTTDNLLYETNTSSGEYILLPKGENFDGIKTFFGNIFTQ